MTNEEVEQEFDEQEIDTTGNPDTNAIKKRGRGRPPQDKDRIDGTGSMDKFLLQTNNYEIAFTPSSTLPRSPGIDNTNTTDVKVENCAHYYTDRNEGKTAEAVPEQLLENRIIKREEALKKLKADREADGWELEKWKNGKSKTDADRQREENRTDNIITELTKRIQTLETTWRE
ncbi:hypothetical protein QAD02_014484 [Eretmocerus hayati]|uniref:Uncharacterized protein n=1 Tax=Eretmocerus hayati TaxID=131215 RepID=A0ACC2P5L2_9HYME|nr:hypothetical protein QAD02_014484 [Eretmocerus hayati]